jgi:hypothetical protein
MRTVALLALFITAVLTACEALDLPTGSDRAAFAVS